MVPKERGKGLYSEMPVLVFTKREQSSTKIAEKHLSVAEKIVKILNKMSDKPWNTALFSTRLLLRCIEKALACCHPYVRRSCCLLYINNFLILHMLLLTIMHFIIQNVPHLISSVHFRRSVVSNSLRPQGLQHASQASLSITQSLRKLVSIELVMSSNHLILCHPLLLLPSIFLSIKVFSSK